ncbi:MAG TPA: hypothetical protein DEP35_23080 [Deltaproteobacteria bacterium]|nr:hypothetical protein [Deltaproteobacteria bacterium]
MTARALLLLALIPYAAWLIFAYDYHFLDGANLLFHEAGHVFFGLFGQTLGMLGGTLGQLVFPVAAGLQFLGTGRAFDACVCGMWLGENLLNVARYMGDAQAMVLPLVGGEIHDWNWLLSRIGLLSHCTQLAGLTHLLGSAVIVASLCGAFIALQRDRSAQTASPGPSGRGPRSLRPFPPSQEAAHGAPQAYCEPDPQERDR